MGRSKTPEATAAKLRAANLGKRMTEETKAKISAANKGRKLTVQDRVRRSLTAIMQNRGERLNERIAADPALAARTRERRREGAAKATAALQRELARRAAKPIRISEGMRLRWEGTRDLRKLAPERL
jgi:hypothetical protein